jgi:glucose-1-phosphate thymidylyltransferase
VFIHNEAIISDFVEINAEDGPVVIDKGTKVSSFSILKGPLYIGKNSVLDKVMISNSIAGNNCRLGGEISDSIIGDYTNKHHEGFLGHSLVGDWVNLGALTTTSDLKNNYGFIHLEFQDKKFATDSIKFGSIIGDCVKTGIGTLLNTGTVIDVGGLIFDGFPRQKYYPPFFWGGIPKQKYELGRFLSDMEIIMARRKCTPSEFIKETTKSIYENET